MATDAARESRLSTPAAEPSRKAASAPPEHPLRWPSGENVHVVHVAGELAPFARSGGLGEAVNSLARFQAASGLPTSIVMPLYDTARNNAPSIEPVGPAFRVQVGPRHETVRLWRLVSAPDDTLAHVKVYFVESEEYFARSYIYGPPGSDYLDNARRYACFSMAAIASLSRIAGKNPVLLHVHD